MRKKLPIPEDLQEQRDAGLSYRKLADHYDVSLATIQRWLNEVYLRTNDTAVIIQDYQLQATYRHSTLILQKGKQVTIKEVCSDHVKVQDPGRLNHLEVPREILRKVDNSTGKHI